MAETIRIASHVRSMIDPDGAVLLDLEKGKYFSLNSVGMEIWKKVETQASRSEIIDHLKSTFGLESDKASEEQLEQDFEIFVVALREKGLIHVAA